MITIKHITHNARCEHATIIAHDETATPGDLMLIPDAFLEFLGECGDDAVAQVIISDHWNEAMNAEPDEYYYCQTHLEQFLDDNTDPNS